MTAGPTDVGSVPGPKIFITYRREETAAHAGRLNDGLEARFGEGNVFMDVDMAPGVDFVKRITEAVAACHVLIVVMGPRWATVEDDQGKPRIADPEDFVRLEVETALRRPDVTPIPVLVAGGRMPDPEILPPEVRAITQRQALELSDQRWHYDVGRLISALDELLAEVGFRPAPPPPARRRFWTVVRAISSRRRLWAGVGAAAVVVAGLAALALALFPDGSADGSDESWKRVDAGASVLDGSGQQQILALASLPRGRAVAVGKSGNQPAVWTFSGSSWSATDLGGELGVMYDVVSARGKIFAVGSRPDEFRQSDAVFWLRSGGGVWRSVCAECRSRGRQVAYAAIAGSNGRFVAVGNDQGRDNTLDAAVWLTEDGGETWPRVAENDADLAGEHSQVMKDVVEVDGRLVAVGRDGTDAAVWTSTDGTDWSRVQDADLAAPIGYLEMNAITTLGSRVVAVGREQATPGGRFAAAAWISFDQGETWRQGTGDFASSGQQLRDVAAAPPELVAVGSDHTPGPVAAVWSSADGETWTRVQSSALAAGDDVVMECIRRVANGTLLGGGSEGGDAAIWESTAR